MNRNLALCIVALAVACDDDQDDQEHDSKDCTWSLNVAALPQGGVSQDLQLDGTITDNTASCAVASVVVAGIPAVASDKNFASWSAKLPIASLRALPEESCDEGAGGKAGTSSGGSSPLLRGIALQIDSKLADGSIVASQCVPVQLAIQPAAPRLSSISVIYPQADYLPLKPTIGAVVTVHATPESAGSSVVIAPEPHLTISPESAPLACPTPDCKETSTSFVVSSKDLGKDAVVLLTASSGLSTTYGELTFQGAPQLFPATALLPAGSKLGVSVNGVGSTCTVKLAAGFGVDAAVCTPEAKSSTCIQPIADPSLGILLVAPQAAATAIITCADAYGQATTGTYTSLEPAAAGQGGTAADGDASAGAGGG